MPTRVGSSGGAQSRVIATDNRFHVFVPTLNGSSFPTNVHRYESTDGQNWGAPSLIASFDNPPLITSPNGYGSDNLPIFYAPFLDAKGFTDGAWTVAFPVNNNGYNNIYVFSSNRGGSGGGGFVNAEANDQFLHGVSIGGDLATWISYYTYNKELAPRSLPLWMQAIYIPQFGIPVGADLDKTINPTAWGRLSRGGSLFSFVAGDYNGIASNPFKAASIPHVNESMNTNDLFQHFVQEPPGPLQEKNFLPNYMPFPLGADLTRLSKVVFSIVPQRAHRASSSYLRFAEGGKANPDSDTLAPSVGPYPTFPIGRP